MNEEGIKKLFYIGVDCQKERVFSKNILQNAKYGRSDLPYLAGVSRRMQSSGDAKPP